MTTQKSKLSRNKSYNSKKLLFSILIGYWTLGSDQISQTPISKMEKEELVGSKIDDPRQRLLNRVAACMLKEPNFYQTSDSKVVDLLKDLAEVLEVDPEFISQLAYYSRNTLNLRSVSNFLLAYAACHEQSREYVSQYFTATVRLPTDLAEVIEAAENLVGNIPSVLQRLVRLKFKEFNTYQMGKYCSEGRRKRTMAKNKKKGEELKMEI